MTRVSLVLGLVLAVGMAAGDGIAVAPYRDLGRSDPLNSRIIEGASVPVAIPATADGGGYVYVMITGDPLIPKLRRVAENDPEIRPLPQPDAHAILTLGTIEAYESEVRLLITRRDFPAAIAAADRTLGLIRAAEEGASPTQLTAAELSRLTAGLLRWQAAAREGQLQAEARRIFMQKQIRLEGIIWDETDPVAILNGTSCSAGDACLGLVVRSVNPRSVDVILAFEGRKFLFALGLD